MSKPPQSTLLSHSAYSAIMIRSNVKLQLCDVHITALTLVATAAVTSDGDSVCNLMQYNVT